VAPESVTREFNQIDLVVLTDMTKLIPVTVFPIIFLQTRLKIYTSAVAAVRTVYLAVSTWIIASVTKRLPPGGFGWHQTESEPCVGFVIHQG
jgi:hypothetical protein